jgi:hypothetical protein
MDDDAKVISACGGLLLGFILGGFWMVVWHWWVP